MLKNKIVSLRTLRTSSKDNSPRLTTINCIVTSDEKGKTVSLITSDGTYTFAFEDLEKCFEAD